MPKYLVLGFFAKRNIINMQHSAVCLMKWGALDESVFDELVMY